MGIRVLRLMEYVYPDAELAEDDRARWAVQDRREFGRIKIRSAMIQNPWQEDPITDLVLSQTESEPVTAEPDRVCIGPRRALQIIKEWADIPLDRPALDHLSLDLKNLVHRTDIDS